MIEKKKRLHSNFDVVLKLSVAGPTFSQSLELPTRSSYHVLFKYRAQAFPREIAFTKQSKKTKQKQNKKYSYK